LKPTLLFWAPVVLGYKTGGDVANEVARLSELSNEFDLRGYLSIDIDNLADTTKVLDFWFGKTVPRIALLPTPRLRYGFRLFWGVVLGMYVSIAMILTRLGEPVEIVLTRYSISSLPVLLTSKILRIRSVYNVLTVPFGYKEAGLLGGVAFANPITRAAFRLIDYACLYLADFVAIGSPADSKEILQKTGIPERKVISLVYPLPDYFFGTTSKPRQTDGITLAYFGSISAYYDFGPLIEAVHELSKDGVRVNLRIQGSGPGSGELRTMIDSRQPQNVTFNEVAIPRSSIPSELGSVSAIVLPLRKMSTSALPIKSIEAMALGIPLVVSNPSDSSVFLDGETCLCVRENSKAAWKTALLRLQDASTVERVINGGREVASAYRPGQNNAALLAILSPTTKN